MSYTLHFTDEDENIFGTLNFESQEEADEFEVMIQDVIIKLVDLQLTGKSSSDPVVCVNKNEVTLFSPISRDYMTFKTSDHEEAMQVARGFGQFILYNAEKMFKEKLN